MAPAFNARHRARFILLIQKKLTRHSPSNLLKTKKPDIQQGREVLCKMSDLN